MRQSILLYTVDMGSDKDQNGTRKRGIQRIRRGIKARNQPKEIRKHNEEGEGSDEWKKEAKVESVENCLQRLDRGTTASDVTDAIRFVFEEGGEEDIYIYRFEIDVFQKKK